MLVFRFFLLFLLLLSQSQTLCLFHNLNHQVWISHVNDFLEKHIKTQYDALLECYDFVYNVNFIDLMYACLYSLHFIWNGSADRSHCKWRMYSFVKWVQQLVGIEKSHLLVAKQSQPIQMKINQNRKLFFSRHKIRAIYLFSLWITRLIVAPVLIHRFSTVSHVIGGIKHSNVYYSNKNKTLSFVDHTKAWEVLSRALRALLMVFFLLSSNWCKKLLSILKFDVQCFPFITSSRLSFDVKLRNSMESIRNYHWLIRTSRKAHTEKPKQKHCTVAI